jgi:hypothetical protein
VLESGSQFQRFDLLARVFQHFGGHARSPQARGLGVGDLHQRDGPVRHGLVEQLERVLVGIELKVPRPCSRKPLSEPKPSITAVGS